MDKSGAIAHLLLSSFFLPHTTNLSIYQTAEKLEEKNLSFLVEENKTICL
ncbi:MAG: hypothetical protein F6K25_09715 [Okeania sp. SIO2G4]|nr:hypothetical protein [Okeania sp. SIO2G5]NEP05246.1 hypothetical protein [Okeania sp. SIO4D6]NEP72292.1 hypothetical protein [Okeania sp. SIO2G5]NEP94259.1 hypothetical protein [Okeania sp. SIO2F5]NEQ90972.1 hypothetical protein [Okeania sp. SIO2G4]